MKTERKPIWYLAGPFYQYNEDVKALAKKAGVVIIDALVTEDRSNAAEDVPTVTLKTDGKPAPVEAVATPPVTPKSEIVTDGTVDLGNGRTITTAELDERAVKLSSHTAAAFKKLKKAEREGFVLAALEMAKAEAA